MSATQERENIFRIDENTWRIEDGGVRFFLFCGTEKAALIDSGMSKPDARSIAESLTKLPLIALYTHADPDHISGNGAFGEAFMNPAEEENFRRNGGTGTVVPVKEGDEIDLGGRVLKIIEIPGHTPGSIAIFDEKNRVLVSGDTIQDSNIFMFGPGRNLEQFAESLRHLSLWDGLYDVIYAMHGTFPVKPELTGLLLEGAQEILAKTAQGTSVKMFGGEVTLYRFPYAGFLCNPEK